MGFISPRLKRGFLSVLQLIIAHAVLDTSSWRVEVDPNWVAQYVARLAPFCLLQDTHSPIPCHPAL